MWWKCVLSQTSLHQPREHYAWTDLARDDETQLKTVREDFTSIFPWSVPIAFGMPILAYKKWKENNSFGIFCEWTCVPVIWGEMEKEEEKEKKCLFLDKKNSF